MYSLISQINMNSSLLRKTPPSIAQEVATLRDLCAIRCAWCKNGSEPSFYKWCHCPGLVYHRKCHDTQRLADIRPLDLDKDRNLKVDNGGIWTCGRCGTDYQRKHSKQESITLQVKARTMARRQFSILYLYLGHVCFFTICVPVLTPLGEWPNPGRIILATLYAGFILFLTVVLAYDYRPRGWGRPGLLDKEYVQLYVAMNEVEPLQ
jgi:hypothetical protein